MALTTTYLNTTKNFDNIINAVLTARAPERFTGKFLEDLGFKSSNDRLIINVFKAIGLLDDSGQPTQRYYDFLDQTQSKTIFAIGIQEAYQDLFNLRVDAQNMTNDEIKNKLKTLTQGQKGDKVIECMSKTFRVLCDYADWTMPAKGKTIEIANENSPKPELLIPKAEAITSKADSQKAIDMSLRYDIHVHLPETTNMAVYDVIFQSLKKHLL
jgi:hypothetical protein